MEYSVVARSSSSDGGCKSSSSFQMPLHYPRYTQADYEIMPEWRLDCLLKQYGLPIVADLQQRRIFAMGAFIWPHPHH
ncbi:unnamed protein product [Lathyrus oleraceus]